MAVDMLPALSNSDWAILLLVLLTALLYSWNKLLQRQVDVKTRHLKEQMDENQMLYHALLEREKLRQDYFLGLSHELRTPLHVILSALQLEMAPAGAEIPSGHDARCQRVLELIQGNSLRLLRVITNLIDINKLDAHALVLNPSQVNLAQETRRLFEAAKPWFQKKTVRLSFEETDSNMTTVCDRENFERVLLNLLSNALKFTPAGGDVLISLVRNRISGDLVLSVKDNGGGIPAADHDRIFEKYLQLERSLARSAEGNGLGLAIVKGLVELEGGSVQVISSEGKGAEFRVHYPAREPDVQAADSQHLHRETLDYRIQMEFAEILQGH